MLYEEKYKNFLKNHNGSGILLKGRKGLYMTKGAEYLAKRLLCLHEGADDCSCASCKRPLDRHPDYIYLKSEVSLGVDDMEPIMRVSTLVPCVSNRFVAVIDGFDSLTVQAQNKLLKMIEENRNILVIGVCYSDSVLDTLNSRMQIIRINPLSEENFLSYCSKEGIDGGSLRYYMTAGCPELLDSMKDVESIFFDVAKYIQKRDVGNLLSVLHLLKEKDNDAFPTKHKEFLPQMMYFIDGIYSRWYVSLFVDEKDKSFQFDRNISKEQLEKCLSLIRHECIRCTMSGYEKNNLFHLLTKIL